MCFCCQPLKVCELWVSRTGATVPVFCGQACPCRTASRTVFRVVHNAQPAKIWAATSMSSASTLFMKILAKKLTTAQPAVASVPDGQSSGEKAVEVRNEEGKMGRGGWERRTGEASSNLGISAVIEFKLRRG